MVEAESVEEIDVYDETDVEYDDIEYDDAYDEMYGAGWAGDYVTPYNIS